MIEDLQFLEKIKRYIECKEVDKDGEWGSGRTLKELIDQNEMPKEYHEVLEKIKLLQIK